MRSFLKTFFAVILGLGVFSGILFLFFFILLSAATADEEVAVEDKSVLHLKLNGIITERASDDPLAEAFPELGDARTGLLDLKKNIKAAAEDDRIEGIYLEAGIVQGGFATVEEIRNELKAFRESGKWVVAYSEYYTEKGYYLASVADEIVLYPEGQMELNGLAAEITFFKGMLDKLEIEPQIFRVGTYKSFVEPYIRKDMSEANREQINAFLGSINQHMIGEIATSRGIDKSRLTEISDGMLVRSAGDALDMNLITATDYYDQVQKGIKERLGLEDDDEINYITYKDYKKAPGTGTYVRSDNEIAVIVGQGNIVSGPGDDETIGSDVIAKAIREARLDDDIKAIVLRINSPGGSALASDVMWREVVLASEAKPIIASMSDVAASGGYYMAMACDTIVAQPNTITGSIGIFGILFNAQGFLNNKIGITTDVVSTGKYSNLITLSRPLSEDEKAIIQNNVEDGYRTFTSKAAEGRNMDLDALLEVASGRVWTGVDAKRVGLVDVLGGFDDAVDIAAAKAGVSDDYKVRFYPEQKNFFEQLFGTTEAHLETKALREQYGDMYPYLEQARKLQEYQGVMAVMPYELDIH